MIINEDFLIPILPILFPTGPGRSTCILRVHPRCPHYLNQLKPGRRDKDKDEDDEEHNEDDNEHEDSPEGRDIILDLVDIILRHPLVLSLSLLLIKHISTGQLEIDDGAPG